jgi:hypothetical protein
MLYSGLLLVQNISNSSYSPLYSIIVYKIIVIDFKGEYSMQIYDNDDNVERAQKLFTDRTEFLTIFRNKMEETRSNKNAIHVVNFYGIGGIGKTGLCNKIVEEINKENSDIKYAKFDFELSVEEIDVLTIIKNDLIRRYKFKFPVFEYALYYYALKSGKAADKSYVNSVIENNPTLKIIRSFMGVIPVASTIADVLSAADDTATYVKNIWQDKKRRSNIAEMEVMDLPDLKKRMQKYFAIDMKENLKDSKEPFVFILDTYEKEVNEAGGLGQPLYNDLWLRDTARDSAGLILLIPNVLWIIAGREILKWKELDRNWDDNSLDTHILGGLSAVDACSYLETAGIYDKTLREKIYEKTKGIPFHLDLCVDQYNILIEKNRTALIEEFDEDIGKLTARYLRYMGDQEKEILYFMSCMSGWTDKSFLEACRGIFLHLNEITYEKLKKLSFCISEDGMNYYLHSNVWETIFHGCPQGLKRRYMEYIRNRINESSVNSDFNLYMDKLRLDLDFLSNSSGDFAKGIAAILDDTKEKLKEYLDFYELKKFELLFLPLWTRIQDYKDTEAFIKLTIFYGYYYLKNGEYQSAQQLVEKADICNRQVEIGTEMNFKELEADSLYYLGKYKDALVVYGEVYEIRKRIFGENHPDTIIAMGSIGRCMTYIGNFEEALKLKKEVYERLKVILGDNHPNILLSLNNIARDLSALGRFEEALEINQKVYEDMKSAFGKNHPITLRVLNNIARDLTSMQSYEKAYSIKKKAYEKTNAVLGENHPDTIFCLNSIAAALSHLERFTEALEINEQAYLKGIEILKENHPDLLHSMNNLSVNMSYNGKYEEGLTMSTKAYEGLKEVFGANHPSTMVSLHNISVILSYLGRYEEADRMKEEVNAVSSEVLLQKHPDALKLPEKE